MALRFVDIFPYGEKYPHYRSVRFRFQLEETSTGCFCPTGGESHFWSNLTRWHQYGQNKKLFDHNRVLYFIPYPQHVVENVTLKDPNTGELHKATLFPQYDMKMYEFDGFRVTETIELNFRVDKSNLDLYYKEQLKLLENRV